MSVLEQETDMLSLVELSNTASIPNCDEWTAADKYEKFVAFFLGNGIYCISSRSVCEVVHPLRVAPLPNAPSYISGIAAFRGEVVAVIDIKKVLGLESSDAAGKAKLVILQSKIKDTQFAIPVDSMHELISISPDFLVADQISSDGMTCIVEHEGKTFRLIETDVLFEMLEQNIG